MNDLSIAFFGTPKFAVYTLEALEAAGIVPDIVVTQPDRPFGRGLKLKPSDVKVWAESRDIPVLDPESLKKESEELDLIQNSEWDLFIVSAYGNILPQNVLSIPRKGTLNVHPSLLPKFRGASPIESQILADEKNIGVTIMLMDAELDHGPILSQASVTPEEWPLRASMLTEMFGVLGGELLAETIPPWIKGEITPEEQDHAHATHTKKIQKADGEINLADDGYTNYVKFCAYENGPGTFFFIEKNEKKIRVKILDAEYRNGNFLPITVIPEGRTATQYADFLKSFSS